MKKYFVINVSLCCFSFLFSFCMNAQVTFPQNFNPGNLPTRFVGWDNTVGVPLRVEHEGNQPIIFATNSFTRMLIDNGNQTQSGGRIAIGNNLPAGFVPQSRVHIHQTGGGGLNNTFIRFTP